MKRLMAVDLHEDSSDEEYNPDNEVVEQVTYKHLYSKISVLIIQESLQLIWFKQKLDEYKYYLILKFWLLHPQIRLKSLDLKSIHVNPRQ